MVDRDGRRWARLLDWRLQLIVALAFAGLALLLDAGHSASLSALNVNPVDVRLPSAPASVGPIQFKIGYSGVYEVVILLTGFPDKQAYRAGECALGISLEPETYCGALSPAMNVAWRLQQLRPSGVDSASVIRTDNGVAAGQARGGGFSTDMVYRRLTIFAAQRGEVYSLLVDSHFHLASLERFRARVRVQPSMQENENLILRYVLVDVGTWLAATAGAALGASTLVFAGASLYRRRRKAG